MQQTVLTRLARGLIVLVFAAAASQVVSVQTAVAAPHLSVCASGCQFTTIADAVATATVGASIQIGPGVYAGGFTINQSVSLVGSGAAKTTISGGEHVVTVASPASVTISGVTITGGQGLSSQSAGAGIYNLGALNLSDSAVSGNNAAFGGGISNQGSLTAVRTTISGNSVNLGAGGGIDNSGTLRLDHSLVSDNHAFGTQTSSAGGGILNRSTGTASLQNTTVSANTAVSSGGIANLGTLMSVRTAVSGNSAGIEGGGIGNDGTLTLRTSLVSGNDGGFQGGGIDNTGTGTVTLDASLVGRNNALFGGGGIYSDGQLTLRGSVVSGNSAGFEGGGILSNGSVTLSGSLVSGNTPDDCVGC